MPDWAWVHRELRRPNVTLALLWEEYRAGAPDGFGYSWVCDLYRGWAGRLQPTMRQTHVAGDKLFVDFAGRTGEVVDGLTGEIIPVQIFVAVLGASSFTYAEAVWSQKLPDWIAAHVRAFAYFGGVACQTVSDNLKAGITKACFHEPTVNRTYADLARHYGTAIVPARPYKPRDEAKVEVGVQVVGRWIMARLRHRRFFSLAEDGGSMLLVTRGAMAVAARPDGPISKKQRRCEKRGSSWPQRISITTRAITGYATSKVSANAAT